MVVEVVELSEELRTTLVIAHQNLEVSSRLWIAVPENSEGTSVGLYQAIFFLRSWKILIIRLASLAVKYSAYLSICELLSWLKHNVSSILWNFFPDFLIRYFMMRDLCPHWVILGVENLLFRLKMIRLKLWAFICLTRDFAWNYLVRVQASIRCCATLFYFYYRLFDILSGRTKTYLSCKRVFWL